MNNFGVIEVASTKTKNAPGWAYVPDTAPSATAFQVAPTSRKNRAARNTAALGLSDLSARQDAKVRKEIEALDKEPPNRDVAVPTRGGGGRSQNKHTPNVRKILQSQKTFANHLDDYVAFLALEGTNPGQSSSAVAGTPVGSAARKPAVTAGKSTGATKTGSAKGKTVASMPQPPPTPTDIPMPDAPSAETPAADQQPNTEPRLAPGPTSYPPDSSILPPYNRAPPASHPGDTDPLLMSRVVPFPTDAELQALMTAPPLSYLEARAVQEEGSGYPPRYFCEVCGYWGRVKCGKCGGRVCALDCLETHREECLRRYGL